MPKGIPGRELLTVWRDQLRLFPLSSCYGFGNNGCPGPVSNLMLFSLPLPSYARGSEIAKILFGFVKL